MLWTYRVHKVRTESIAKLLDARCDFIKTNCLLVSICNTKTLSVIKLKILRTVCEYNCSDKHSRNLPWMLTGSTDHISQLKLAPATCRTRYYDNNGRAPCYFAPLPYYNNRLCHITYREKFISTFTLHNTWDNI